MSDQTFGDKLKAYRKKHHLTQEQLAEKMKITGSHISSLERGEKQPKTKTAQAFQRLMEEEEWDRFDIVKELSDEEFLAYMNLWQRMRRLGPEKEKEVMIAFLNILQLL